MTSLANLPALPITQIVFFAFAALAIVSGTLVVTQNNPVRSALALVLTFFASAGLWLLMQAEFLSLILVLVYVGAVMTLFLFVIMMLDIDAASLRKHFMRYLPLGLGIVGLLTFLMYAAIHPENFHGAHLNKSMLQPENYSNTFELGKVLYTNYALPFIIAGILLLVAIISAITLAHRGPRNVKTQHPRKQILVRSEDRIELVKMKAEKE